jgi:hypothetical protein
MAKLRTILSNKDSSRTFELDALNVWPVQDCIAKGMCHGFVDRIVSGSEETTIESKIKLL